MIMLLLCSMLLCGLLSCNTTEEKKWLILPCVPNQVYWQHTRSTKKRIPAWWQFSKPMRAKRYTRSTSHQLISNDTSRKSSTWSSHWFSQTKHCSIRTIGSIISFNETTVTNEFTVDCHTFKCKIFTHTMKHLQIDSDTFLSNTARIIIVFFFLVFFIICVWL